MRLDMETQLQVEAEPQAQQPAQASTPARAWSLPTRLAFRFGFVYLVLYGFPGPLGFLPGADWIFGWYVTATQKLVIWTGAHVLHLGQPVQYVPTGSGDTLHNYIENLLILAIAVVAMLVWSVLDRKRREYTYLYQWLRFYVRLVLGATLLSYGAAKVIKSQFPNPFLARLLEPYGDSSPMGLLWTFMGYSKPYNIFTGLVEMVGGALVIVPRLATLGALISVAAMANVFILNMAYDVPVKIYSLNLMLMGCFLLLPELRRLTNVFILNREAQPVVAPPFFRRRWLNLGMLAVQLLFLVYCASAFLNRSYQGSKLYGDLAPRPPLYGIYAVDEFSLEGQVRPPLWTDELRWRRVTFDLYNSVNLQTAEGPMQRYNGKLDLAAKTLQLSKRAGDPNWKANFTIEPDKSSPGMIALSGEMDGKKIQAKLRKVEVNNFLLNSRGFHWISEFPFNR
jgi:uncharacterized membrane protein YphA (DoxX/SURF4 family)